jgi:hypothetical protein
MHAIRNRLAATATLLAAASALAGRSRRPRGPARGGRHHLSARRWSVLAAGALVQPRSGVRIPRTTRLPEPFEG